MEVVGTTSIYNIEKVERVEYESFQHTDRIIVSRNHELVKKIASQSLFQSPLPILSLSVLFDHSPHIMNPSHKIKKKVNDEHASHKGTKFRLEPLVVTVAGAAVVEDEDECEDETVEPLVAVVVVVAWDDVDV